MVWVIIVVHSPLRIFSYQYLESSQQQDSFNIQENEKHEPWSSVTNIHKFHNNKTVSIAMQMKNMNLQPSIIILQWTCNNKINQFLTSSVFDRFLSWILIPHIGLSQHSVFHKVSQNRTSYKIVSHTTQFHIQHVDFSIFKEKTHDFDNEKAMYGECRCSARISQCKHVEYIITKWNDIKMGILIES